MRFLWEIYVYMSNQQLHTERSLKLRRKVVARKHKAQQWDEQLARWVSHVSQTQREDQATVKQCECPVKEELALVHQICQNGDFSQTAAVTYWGRRLQWRVWELVESF